MAWINGFMWWLCEALGTAMTLTGLIGLLALLGHGLMWLTDKILEME